MYTVCSVLFKSCSIEQVNMKKLQYLNKRLYYYKNAQSKEGDITLVLSFF